MNRKEWVKKARAEITKANLKWLEEHCTDEALEKYAALAIEHLQAAIDYLDQIYKDTKETSEDEIQRKP